MRLALLALAVPPTLVAADIEVIRPTELAGTKFECFHHNLADHLQTNKTFRISVSQTLHLEALKMDPSPNVSDLALFNFNEALAGFGLTDSEHFVPEDQTWSGEKLNTFSCTVLYATVTPPVLIHFQSPHYVGRPDFNAARHPTVTDAKVNAISDQIDQVCNTNRVELEQLLSLARAVVDGDVEILVSPGSQNAFEPLYRSSAYQLVFAQALPIFYTASGLQGFFYLFEQHFLKKTQTRTNSVSLKNANEKSDQLKLQAAILVLESTSLVICAAWFFYDGWWSVYFGATFPARMSMVNLLAGFSLCTTMLSYTLWIEVSGRITNVFQKQSESLIWRNKVKICAAVFSLSMDFYMLVFDLEFAYRNTMVVGGYYLLMTILFGILFFSASFKTLRTVTVTMTDSDPEPEGIERSSAKMQVTGSRRKRKKERTSAAAAQVRRIVFWMKVSAVAMFGYSAMLIIIAFTSAIYTPMGWAWSWALLIMFRLFVSFSQIQMCRMPKRHRVQNTVSVRASKTLTFLSSRSQVSSEVMPESSLRSKSSLSASQMSDSLKTKTLPEGS